MQDDSLLIYLAYTKEMKWINAFLWKIWNPSSHFLSWFRVHRPCEYSSPWSNIFILLWFRCQTSNSTVSHIMFFNWTFKHTYIYIYTTQQLRCNCNYDTPGKHYKITKKMLLLLRNKYMIFWGIWEKRTILPLFFT